jgi:hypothetical protein
MTKVTFCHELWEWGPTSAIRDDAAPTSSGSVLFEENAWCDAITEQYQMQREEGKRCLNSSGFSAWLLLESPVDDVVDTRRRRLVGDGGKSVGRPDGYGVTTTVLPIRGIGGNTPARKLKIAA